MKEKYKLYILVPLAVAVWGYAIVALLDISGGGAVGNGQKLNLELPEHIEINTNDFDLLLNYKDPFLRNQPKKSEEQETPNPTIENKTIAPAKPEVKSLQWPKLTYKGTIKNKDNNSLLAILEINGSEVLIKEGEQYENLRLLKVDKDSVLIGFETEQNYIRKSAAVSY